MKELKLYNNLKAYRKKKNISQEKLAELIGVTRQTISSIENLQYCPSAKLALLIVYALDEQFENVFYLDVPND
ncbi:helix-turn-helix transcriptional regulator [Blautia schinkii]|nr:helix-turn-helix transcriptional regulator [Blautia schinkii]